MQLVVLRFEASLEAARAAAAHLAAAAPSATTLPDNELLAAQRALADVRRSIDAVASLIAGEIGHRSRRELGYDGLAQRAGFRTAESLVQHTTGSTARDASTLVNVGTMVLRSVAPDRSTGATPTEPWLADVAAAVARGNLSLDAAQAIRTGLGQPDLAGAAPDNDRGDAQSEASTGVTIAALTNAARQLLAEAPHIHADQLLRRARELRDELDAAGIADRERAIYEQRAIRRVRRPNGLSRYIVDPDLESAAFWDDLYDKTTSPRRGGPRFVDRADRAWADAVSRDERTTEQYVHDTFTQLLRIAAGDRSTESQRLIGSRQPAVRVLVTDEALRTRTGHGRIEGIAAPISIETVERIACESGTVPLQFDDEGQALNLGREHRLHTTRQRILIAARDGGCLFGGCDRPPSWCEVHHIEHWHRDRGSTNLADGVLLCRHHHLLVHNNHWEIARDHVGYWLIPPAAIDPDRMPQLMPSKSPALRDLRDQRALQPA